MASSAVYILNDWWDREEDAWHPIKRNRPIAAGLITGFEIFGFCVLLSFAALMIAVGINTQTFLVIAGYLALQVAYTVKLKEVEFADTLAIASGFVLRAVGGAVGVNVPITTWFLVCVFFGALLLASGKRTAEGHDQSGVVLVAAAITICSYSLYAMQHKPMLFTLPLVCYGIFRYLAIISGGGGEEMEKEMYDGRLFVCLILWLLMSFAIYYR
jgi:4-hydroxybenzoate polyprenyltransferase